jgi:transposase
LNSRPIEGGAASARDVKAYLKRNKNNAADATAICEAVRRPIMRFVLIKTAEQQGQLMQHRTRDLLMRQRTQLINALRAHLAELGVVAAQVTRASRNCSRSWRTSGMRVCRSMRDRA